MVRSLVQIFKLRSVSFCFPSTPSSNFGSGTAWKMSSRGPEKCYRHWEQGFAWQIRTCSTRSCSALHFLLSHLVTSSHILCLFIAQWWRRKGYWSDGPILLIGHVSGTSCMIETGSIRGTSQCAQYPCYPEKANRLTESKPRLLRLQNSGKQMGWRCLKTTLNWSKLCSNLTYTFFGHTLKSATACTACVRNCCLQICFGCIFLLLFHFLQTRFNPNTAKHRQ